MNEKKSITLLGLLIAVVSLILTITQALRSIPDATILIPALLIGQVVTLLAVILLLLLLIEIQKNR